MKVEIKLPTLLGNCPIYWLKFMDSPPFVGSNDTGNGFSERYINKYLKPYRARFIDDDSPDSYGMNEATLAFDSEEALTMFILRWS